MTKFLIFLLVCAPFVLFACSAGDGNAVPNKAPEVKKKFHENGDISKASATPLADQIKAEKLNLSSSKTVGEVFNSYKYATHKEWREQLTKSGVIYVDFVCQLDARAIPTAEIKAGVVKRLLDVKFSIRDNGEAYVALITVIDTLADGKTKTTNYQADEVMFKIVKAIYDNKKIVL